MLRANKNQINLYFTSKQNTGCKLLINVPDTKAEKTVRQQAICIERQK